MKSLATLGLAAAMFVSSAASTEAAFKLRISSDANNDGDYLDLNESFTITDDGAGDGLPGFPGALLFSGTVGDYELNVETATSTSPSGNPLLTLTSTNNNPAGVPGDLKIELTDTGYNLPGGVTALLNGTSLFGNLSFLAYTGIGEFSLLNPIGAAQNAVGAGVFAYGTSQSAAVPAGHDSLTFVVNITGGTDGTTQFDISVTPEPATMGLFGLALLGLGGAIRRRFVS